MLNGYKTYIGIIGTALAGFIGLDIQEQEINAIILALTTILAIYGRYQATKK